jgi:hypothetical protein
MAKALMDYVVVCGLDGASMPRALPPLDHRGVCCTMLTTEIEVIVDDEIFDINCLSESNRFFNIYFNQTMLSPNICYINKNGVLLIIIITACSIHMNRACKEVFSSS